MVDEVQFKGGAHKLGVGPAAAQIAIRSDELWVYVEESNDLVQVWSGAPCRKCRRRGTRWLRCSLHERCKMIAVQLDLI